MSQLTCASISLLYIFSVGLWYKHIKGRTIRKVRAGVGELFPLHGKVFYTSPAPLSRNFSNGQSFNMEIAQSGV